MKNTMKRLVLLMAFSIIMSCSSDDKNIGTVNDDFISIPDENFETILIEQGIDTDGIINQQILKVDAEKVTILELDYISTRIIQDLTGIEGFVNLKKLVATKHEIENIDLSSNVLLNTLYLAGNLITSIDLSKNTELIEVDIQSNLLETVTGLSNATQLKSLDLSWNYIEEFSIENESLEVLHLRNNDLTTININGCVNLKNILLTTNFLTSIDLSTNILLETLLIPDNKIESIDLEPNVHLTHLYLFSNLLTELDVSYNTALMELKSDRNPALTCIKIMDDQHILAVTKSNNQELKSICN